MPAAAAILVPHTETVPGAAVQAALDYTAGLLPLPENCKTSASSRIGEVLRQLKNESANFHVKLRVVKL